MDNGRALMLANFNTLLQTQTNKLNEYMVDEDQLAKSALNNGNETLRTVNSILSAFKQKISQLNGSANSETLNNLAEMRDELVKISREREARRNSARDKKEEKKLVKSSVETKLNELKRQLDNLMKENHELEQQLAKEQDQVDLPAVLKLMRS